MNNSQEILVAALREELTHYGEMLALLDQQQDLVVARAATELLPTVTAINQECAALQTARHHRDGCRAAVARALGLPDGCTFAELLPRLPEAYRLLISALVEENNHLLARVRQRARQNHLLLSRSIELMRQLLGTLAPGAKPTVYDGSGQLFAGGLNGNALYDAVG